MWGVSAVICRRMLRSFVYHCFFFLLQTCYEGFTNLVSSILKSYFKLGSYVAIYLYNLHKVLLSLWSLLCLPGWWWQPFLRFIVLLSFRFYNSLPPVSKAYGTMCLVATTAFHLGLYPPVYTALIYEFVFKHFQVWNDMYLYYI